MLCRQAESLSIGTCVVQRNTIRDIDTGQVFVLDTGEGGGVLDLPKNSAGYTDMVSGTKMTADEFDRALGLAGVLGVCAVPSTTCGNSRITCQHQSILSFGCG